MIDGRRGLAALKKVLALGVKSYAIARRWACRGFHALMMATASLICNPHERL